MSVPAIGGTLGGHNIHFIVGIETLESRLCPLCSTRLCYVISWCVTLRVLHYMLYYSIFQYVMVCSVIFGCGLFCSVIFPSVLFCIVLFCSALFSYVLLYSWVSRPKFSNSEKSVNADVSMSVSAPSDRPDDCKGSRDVVFQCPERPFVARIFYRP